MDHRHGAAGRTPGRRLQRPVDGDTLREAVHDALPVTDLGELESIKRLPGMVSAATGTLRKAWLAGLDLPARGADQPRVEAMARLEAAVLRRLPTAMKRPQDLVATAMARLQHAPRIVGELELRGLLDLPPVWRPLLLALAEQVDTRWLAGATEAPAWLTGGAVRVETSPAERPQVQVVSAGTAYHEAIEAMRWVRELLASGRAQAGEIAIAATMTDEYDHHLLSLRADANLPLHFAHGMPVAATRPGQAAAALADVLVRGLSQSRMRRLNTLLASEGGPFEKLPEGWLRLLPGEAPLDRPEAWQRLLGWLQPEDWPDGQDHTATLRSVVELLWQGTSAAAEAGETLLGGRARLVWRKALASGPAATVDLTLEGLRVDDQVEPTSSVAWMPAGMLHAAPRPFVRLLGLNSARWPRSGSEDPLLPDHLVPARELDPLPAAQLDRALFYAILAGTRSEVVLSRSRRGSESRLLGKSALLQGQPDEVALQRHAVPTHAMSETDRLIAQPEEFAGTDQAASALACWQDWGSSELTPHDGLVPEGHPLIQAILRRRHSATSLQMLMRDPLGYTWRYGLGLRAPRSGEEQLLLDALAFGELVHGIVQHSLQTLEADGGFLATNDSHAQAAVLEAAKALGQRWVAERPTPPRQIWLRQLHEAKTLAERALSLRDEGFGSGRSFGEVAFGGDEGEGTAPDQRQPWDPTALVTIPETELTIGGRIDHLDLSDDGRRAWVRDYKTGRLPSKPNDLVIGKGKELQRCLYAYAVQALLGDEVEVRASLVYLRDGVRELPLTSPAATLAQLRGHLLASHASLGAGHAVPGPDTADGHNDMALALPAYAGAYWERKRVGVETVLGEAASVWEQP